LHYHSGTVLRAAAFHRTSFDQNGLQVFRRRVELFQRSFKKLYREIKLLPQPPPTNSDDESITFPLAPYVARVFRFGTLVSTSLF
jgi:hypothetical protein